MDNTTSQTPTTISKGFGLEELLKSAFDRTKERFLSYFLTYLLSFLIGLGAGLAVLVVIGLNLLVYIPIKSVMVSSLLGLVSFVGIILGMIYVSSWTTLAMANTIVSGKKVGSVESFKAVKPLVWKYYFVMLMTSIFMFGLLPWGFMSLFILFIIWGVWGSLTLFVFLEKQESGLRNLFISKAMVQSRFWGVLLRIVLVYLAYYLILWALNMTHGKEGNALTGIVSFGVSLFAQPFLMSYLYEIYKHLEHPTKVGSNIVWKILSVLGWVVMFLTLVVAIMAAIKQGPSLMKDLQRNKSIEKNLQKDIPEPQSGEFQQFFKDLEASGAPKRGTL